MGFGWREGLHQLPETLPPSGPAARLAGVEPCGAWRTEFIPACWRGAGLAKKQP